jgi:hypothetical protein
MVNVYKQHKELNVWDRILGDSIVGPFFNGEIYIGAKYKTSSNFYPLPLLRRGGKNLHTPKTSSFGHIDSP